MSVYFLGDTCEPLLNVCQFQIDLGGHIGLCRMFEKNKNKTNKQTMVYKFKQGKSLCKWVCFMNL